MDKGTAKNIFNSLGLLLCAEDKIKLGKVADAYFATVDENFSLREENHKLAIELEDKECQIKDLNEKLEEKQKLKLIVNAGIPEYFLMLENGEKVGPVCPICYKKEGATVILATAPDNHAICPNCKAKFAGVHAIIEGKKAVVL
jgi:hypothetical protein